MQAENVKRRQERKSRAVTSRTDLNGISDESGLLRECLHRYWRLHPHDSERTVFADYLGVSEQRLAQYLKDAKMNGADWLKIEKLLGERVYRDWLDIQASRQ